MFVIVRPNGTAMPGTRHRRFKESWRLACKQIVSGIADSTHREVKGAMERLGYKLKRVLF